MDVTYVSQDRGRSRSRSRSRSTSSVRQRRRTGSYGAGGGVVMVSSSRVPRYLRVRGSHAFQMTAQPFCLALGQGTAGTQGINFYPLNGVPNPVTFNNTPMFSLGFNLTGVGTYVNGVLVGTAPIVNYGEYTVLFDAYRIRKVVIDMYYNSNSSTLGPGTSLPMISIANDYDDVNSTNLSSLSQYPTYRQIQFGNNCNNGRVSHTLYPKLQSTVETVAGSALALSQGGNPWVDCNASTALYCGVKGNYDNMNVQSVSVGLVTFYVKYYVEFKNSR